MPLSSRELAGRHDLLRLLPVDDVQVVEIELRGADFERRLAVRDAARRHLDVVGVDEGVAVAGALAGVGEVLRVGRQLDLEALLQVHAAGLLVDAHEGRVAAIDVGVRFR